MNATSDYVPGMPKWSPYGLELTGEVAANYAEVKAELEARLRQGGFMGDAKPPSDNRRENGKYARTPRWRKYNQDAHKVRTVPNLTPGDLRFAEVIIAKHDPWSVLTAVDAAKTARIGITSAFGHIERLRAAKSWPYFRSVAEMRKRRKASV